MSEAFWAAMTAARAALMDLTPRRLILAFAFAILVIALSFAQVGALDTLLSFAADLTLYFDVVSFIVLMAVHRHIRIAMRATARTSQTLLRRGAAQFVRLRNARPRALRPRSALSDRRGDPSPDGSDWRGSGVAPAAA